jgi:hypothetical protein
VNDRFYGNGKFSFITNSNHLPKWWYHFAFPLAMNDSFCCFISSPAFSVVSVQDFGHFNQCVVYILALICISLRTCDVEHLLKWLCVSFMIKWLLRSLIHFLIMLFVCLLLSFKSSLYILDNMPLLMLLWQIFSPSILFVFLFFDTVFHKSENFNFNEVLPYSFFCGPCLWYCI